MPCLTSRVYSLGRKNWVQLLRQQQFLLPKLLTTLTNVALMNPNKSLKCETSWLFKDLLTDLCFLVVAEAIQIKYLSSSQRCPSQRWPHICLMASSPEIKPPEHEGAGAAFLLSLLDTKARASSNPDLSAAEPRVQIKQSDRGVKPCSPRHCSARGEAHFHRCDAFVVRVIYRQALLPPEAFILFDQAAWIFMVVFCNLKAKVMSAAEIINLSSFFSKCIYYPRTDIWAKRSNRYAYNKKNCSFLLLLQPQKKNK